MIAPPEPGYVRANRSVALTDHEPVTTTVAWYRDHGWEALEEDATVIDAGGVYVMVYVWVRSPNYAALQERKAEKAARS